MQILLQLKVSFIKGDRKHFQYSTFPLNFPSQFSFVSTEKITRNPMFSMTHQRYSGPRDPMMASVGGPFRIRIMQTLLLFSQVSKGWSKNTDFKVNFTINI